MHHLEMSVFKPDALTIGARDVSLWVSKSVALYYADAWAMHEQ